MMGDSVLCDSKSLRDMMYLLRKYASVMAGRLVVASLTAAGLLVVPAVHDASVESAPLAAETCYALEVTSLTGPEMIGPGGIGTFAVALENPNPAGTCDDAMRVYVSLNGTADAISPIDGGHDIVCGEDFDHPFAHRQRCLAASFGGGASATITFGLRGIVDADRLYAMVSVLDLDGNPKNVRLRPGKVGEREMRVSAPAPGAPAPSSEGPSAIRTVRRGATGESATTIQYLLRHHGADVVVDGDFGPVTEQAVQDFQRERGLVDDGVVGPQIWQALFVTVQQGSQGDAVSAVQSRLAARGVDIVVDGDFGPQTDASVRQFQADQELDVDGVVGPQTWAALLAAE